MKRVCIYTYLDGTTDSFAIGNHPENEHHERQAAERELRSKRTHVASYHFEWQEDTPSPEEETE